MILMLNLASAHQPWINLRDKALGGVEKNSIIVWPGKKGSQKANALKTVCSNLKGVLRELLNLTN